MISPFSPTAPRGAGMTADAVTPLSQRLAAAAADLPAAKSDADEQARALLAALRRLPPPLTDSQQDRDAYIDAIARQLRDFQHPDGTVAFATLQQQSDALGIMLKEVDKKSPLHEGLMAVMVGTGNLQFQMTKWMQDTLLSDGTPQEFEDW
ncbi:hypothetical protein [Chromobacterium sp. CV08]|uniref:hypothetical protein n=1 Tax=Chromobacterium sp. CV08 TaxID=3133274 RepID=UPI003DA82F69